MLLESISQDLGLPLDFLVTVTKTASHLYKSYEINKRSGGTRTIHHPAKELKTLQRYLLQKHVDRMQTSSHSTAYKRGSSILDSARLHLTGRYLVRIDLKDFFPSITATDLSAMLEEQYAAQAGWEKTDIQHFLKLVCRKERLTIGAPTSPALSNAAMVHIDNALAEHCLTREVVFCRYADDMYFSTSAKDVLKTLPGVVRSVLEKAPYPRNLEMNSSKTLHQSKKTGRRVLGLVLSSEDKISVGRERKRRLNSLVFKLDELTAEERKRLAGELSFVRGVEPSFITRLAHKHGPGKVKRALGKAGH